MVVSVGGDGSCSPFSSQAQISQPKEAPHEAVVVKEEEKEEEEALNCKGGDFHGSSSNEKLKESKPEVVQIKEESIDFVVDDYDGRDCFNYGFSGSYSSSSSKVLPKPMECLLENGPPPFLNKTFQVVDDPETDPIVSWSQDHQSFIVRDCHEFSKTILPKYFKHSNFASFVRQLNTYGFKKVDPDRWEFANEGFQGGKKHLLKSIKRRSRYNRQPQGSNVSVNSTKKARLDAQLETLKKDQDVLKDEILNLKQQQKYSQHQLIAFEERIQTSECKQQTMLLFLTETTREPNFVERLMQKRVMKRELEGGDLAKRRRLISAQGFEDFGDCGDQPQVFADRLPEAELATQQQETPLPASLVDKSCSSVQNNKPQAEVHYVYHDVSKKLLDENSVFDDECAVNDSNVYQELEDLITRHHNFDDLIVKPHDWSGYVSNYLVEQAGCVGSMP
ncbi:PREDICTED: heat stress transcription factor A-2-like [Fragaria vesca subsp. vesca]|uniref:heat stress transcription factor A-2-like n=1 Tax=Fragaria vesca subsp. vesca TaxID=101020 RepID=UPI0002C33D7E|nr:PREDICTED: heat stress transcription factor A-2-like [Fragaria vesca subsp. vesca]